MGLMMRLRNAMSLPGHLKLSWKEMGLKKKGKSRMFFGKRVGRLDPEKQKQMQEKTSKRRVKIKMNKANREK